MPCADHRINHAGCEPCKRYSRLYFGRRATAIAAGTWEYPRPAREVRAHLVKLRRAPMSRKAIAQAAGVSYAIVCDVLAKRRKYVTGPYAAALLAVEAVPTAPAGHVCAVKATRQLRALIAIGYSNPMLNTTTRLSTQTIYHLSRGKRRWVSLDAAARIDTAYNAGRILLATNRPAEAIPGADVRTLRAAARKGWVGPDWWDDDEIADPAARPRRAVPARRDDYLQSNVDDALAGRAPYDELTTAERVEAVRLLAWRGLSDVMIGERMRWPKSPSDRSAEHSPVLRFRTNHKIPIGSAAARDAAGVGIHREYIAA